MTSDTSPHLAAVKDTPEDVAFGIIRQAKANDHPNKVGLSAGVYQAEDGKIWTLPVVEKVKKLLADRPDLNHDYLPIRGDTSYLNKAKELAVGAGHASDPRITSVQTVAGTGANHIAAKFLAEAVKPKTVFLSNPTWANHPLIWQKADPNIKQQFYPYFDPQINGFDFIGMISFLESHSRPGDVIVLHACAHNPTGVDPRPDQWKAIAELCERRRLFPVFDSAYQGFASGDPDHDAWAMRYFLDRDGLELCIAQSFSKNFGLYSERVGALHIKAATKALAVRTGALLEQITRSEISTPPAYGSRIVTEVLGDQVMTKEWHRDLKTMSSRIAEMRGDLYNHLIKLQTPGSWEHILKQIGMFSYMGLTKAQAVMLREKYHIYLLDTGRVALTGLTKKNVEYVAKSIDAVVRHTASQ